MKAPTMSQQPQFAAVNVGDALPPLALPPITRTTLALFAGASGDHNQIHIDTDYARKAGMADVFAHGMLSMAYLARLLTNWVPQQSLRQFGVRFVAITQVGDRISCRGTVVEKFEAGGEKRLRLDLSTVDADGQLKLSGDAVVALG